MRSVTKAVAVATLAVPLVLGGASTASASPIDVASMDEGPSYVKWTHSANVNGGFRSRTVSGFTPDGRAYFYKDTRKAGPTGASGNVTTSRS